MNPKANVNVLSTFNKKRGGLDLIFDPDSGKDTQISESWEFSGMKLYFVLIGSGTSFTLSEGKTYLKVITGKLETPALGCFAEPFEIRNTNVKEKLVDSPTDFSTFGENRKYGKMSVPTKHMDS